MKRKFLTIILILTAGLVTAQHGKGDHHGWGKMRKKFEAQKISYLTQQLNLSPEEAQVFWPVYNEANKKKDDFRNRSRTLYRKLKHENGSLSDKELQQISDELVEIRIKEANLDKEYHLKYKKILPIRKVMELYYSERKFQKMLLHKIRERGRHNHDRK
jgi:hypothetical protein